ncbi:MAG: hypothetical protein RBQ99_02825 [Trichlorobacter sp.]|nr:hypothetical protein [Trichlorobacter sp.]
MLPLDPDIAYAVKELGQPALFWAMLVYFLRAFVPPHLKQVVIKQSDIDEERERIRKHKKLDEIYEERHWQEKIRGEKRVKIARDLVQIGSGNFE